MELLLDTHVLLWWDDRNPKLRMGAREVIENPDNRVLVSSASIWEIAIKRRAGKLKFDGSAAELISANGFEELPMSAKDAEHAGDLDWQHRDPFDRILAAQCRRRNLTLITADKILRRCPGLALLAVQ